MTREEFEASLWRIAEAQLEAGWSDESIKSYEAEQRALWGGDPSCILMIGAGLAADNSRHGVTYAPAP